MAPTAAGPHDVPLTAPRVVVVTSLSPDPATVRQILKACQLEDASCRVVSDLDEFVSGVGTATVLIDTQDLALAFRAASQLRHRTPAGRVLLFAVNRGTVSCLEVGAFHETDGASGSWPAGSHCLEDAQAFHRVDPGCDILSTNGEQKPALSARHLEILKHLASGLSVKETAARMEMSYKSVDSIKYRMMRRLKIRDRVDLTRFAIREGLISP